MNQSEQTKPLIRQEDRAVFSTENATGEAISAVRHYAESKVTITVNGQEIRLCESQVSSLGRALRTDPKDWTNFVWGCDYQHGPHFKQAVLKRATETQHGQHGQEGIGSPYQMVKSNLQLAINSFRVWHFGQAPSLLLIDRELSEKAQLALYPTSIGFGIPIIPADLGEEAFRFVA